MKPGDKVWINYSDIDAIGGSGDIICEGKIVKCRVTSNSEFYLVEYENENYPFEMIQKEFSKAFLTKID